MAKPKDPKTSSSKPYRKGSEVATPDQLRVLRPSITRAKRRVWGTGGRVHAHDLEGRSHAQREPLRWISQNGRIRFG